MGIRDKGLGIGDWGLGKGDKEASLVGWGASAAGGFPDLGNWRLRNETQLNYWLCWVALRLTQPTSYGS
jgi:hypothetical protein